MAAEKKNEITLLKMIKGEGWETDDHKELRSFPDSSAGKEFACKAGDPGWIPGSGRSPGEGKDYPLQYFGLKNSMNCIVIGVAKSQTQLSNFHFHFHIYIYIGFPGGASGKEPACQCRRHKLHKEEEMATHSIILARRILWAQKPIYLCVLLLSHFSRVRLCVTP